MSISVEQLVPTSTQISQIAEQAGEFLSHHHRFGHTRICEGFNLGLQTVLESDGTPLSLFEELNAALKNSREKGLHNPALVDSSIFLYGLVAGISSRRQTEGSHE